MYSYAHASSTQTQVAQANLPTRQPLPQGELFARLMLRGLPIMKSGPEDDAKTVH